MVWHVVLMKPRPNLTAGEREALVAAFERAVREISTVRDVRVGRRVLHGAGYEQAAPDVADFLVSIAFDDLDSLQAYLNHPAHEALAEQFYRSVSPGMAFDFDVTGLEGLSQLTK